MTLANLTRFDLFPAEFHAEVDDFLFAEIDDFVLAQDIYAWLDDEFDAVRWDDGLR